MTPQIFVSIAHYGRCLAQLVEQGSHVQRLCPGCSGPGVRFRTGALCSVLLPLSLILFPVGPSAVLLIKLHTHTHIYVYICILQITKSSFTHPTETIYYYMLCNSSVFVWHTVDHWTYTVQPTYHYNKGTLWFWRRHSNSEF